MEHTIETVMRLHRIYVNVFPVEHKDSPRWKFELYAIKHETLKIDNVSNECKEDMNNTWLYEEAVQIGIERALELVQ